eukprot:CAMPEP_0182883996 /NCGR_PEP_ID=MMETSP0034_2-20130328/18718_1 /TAXON_ID=156128 /ORGANISM="Nephroselmis pyriformis, Strain CCMP717" /LENGTH=50 /DNA_ID=CAMNT_0025017159 /DNA_START=112 /DNA_END=264 /DNA_ORIENTATION=-
MEAPPHRLQISLKLVAPTLPDRVCVCVALFPELKSSSVHPSMDSEEELGL